MVALITKGIMSAEETRPCRVAFFVFAPLNSCGFPWSCPWSCGFPRSRLSSVAILQCARVVVVITDGVTSAEEARDTLLAVKGAQVADAYAQVFPVEFVD